MGRCPHERRRCIRDVDAMLRWRTLILPSRLSRRGTLHSDDPVAQHFGVNVTLTGDMRPQPGDNDMPKNQKPQNFDAL